MNCRHSAEQLYGAGDGWAVVDQRRQSNQIGFDNRENAKKNVQQKKTTFELAHKKPFNHEIHILALRRMVAYDMMS